MTNDVKAALALVSAVTTNGGNNNNGNNNVDMSFSFTVSRLAGEVFIGFVADGPRADLDKWVDTKVSVCVRVRV